MTTAPTPQPEALAAAIKASGQFTNLETLDAAASLIRLQAAERTLQRLGYQDRGGQEWAPPLGQAPDFDLMDRLRARIAELEARKPLPPTDMTPVQHVNALVGDGLTAQKVEAICEREPYDVTGVVLSLPDGRACIVNQSAVRWFRGKRDFWDLMHGEAS